MKIAFQLTATQEDNI